MHHVEQLPLPPYFVEQSRRLMSTDSKAKKRVSPKREAVIKAATDEFLASGFDGTSMDRIADVAEVSKRTVYNHFPSKDDLFQAIVDELLQHTESLPFHEYSKDEPMEEQLKRIGNTFAETITGRDFMKLSRVVLSRFIQSPEWASTTLTAHAKLRANLTSWMKSCKRDNRLVITNMDRAASQFCGLIKELIFWPELMAGQRPASSKDREAAVTSAVKMFIAFYQP